MEQHTHSRLGEQKKKPKGLWGKIWYFLWEEDSIWSWIVNILLAFIVIKFLIYPGLGLAFSTQYPVVAVVSESMEHRGLSFDTWYAGRDSFYLGYNITKEDFMRYSFKNGFNKGDIMVLLGKKPAQLNKGDIIVFFSQQKQPIIHRIIKKWEVNGTYHFQTKGDNNAASIALYGKPNLVGQMVSVSKETPGAVELLDETDISQDEIVGKAVAKIPWLGYIKIVFVELLKVIGIGR